MRNWREYTIVQVRLLFVMQAFSLTYFGEYLFDWPAYCADMTREVLFIAQISSVHSAHPCRCQAGFHRRVTVWRYHRLSCGVRLTSFSVKHLHFFICLEHVFQSFSVRPIDRWSINKLTVFVVACRFWLTGYLHIRVNGCCVRLFSSSMRGRGCRKSSLSGGCTQRFTEANLHFADALIRDDIR